ncbi:MAG TPA: DUF2087 domain-containing protein [Desulfobacteria bacterium]|nr:DUF2087 domain-containing protein [Desulfobacteria bacterium]
MENLSELFWNASLEEMKQGYRYSTENFTCLICGEQFLEGRIYTEDGVMYDARRSIKNHIANEHSSMFAYLLNLDKKYTGITEHQRDLLMLFYSGLSDKDIAAEIQGSASTVRNYRFSFREKEKQAKIFLAVMELLKENPVHKEKLLDYHRGAKMIDQRYAITSDENEKILKQYFKQGLHGPLSGFPSKEKRKLIILRQLVTRFAAGRKYSEQEVNEILKVAYHDHATLRRYLIEYGFMERIPDGSAYWVKS